MKLRILVTLAGAALMALGLAGCGGSGPASEEPGGASGSGEGSLQGLGSPVEVARGELQDPHVAIDPEDGRVYVAWAKNEAAGSGEHEHGGGGHDEEMPEYNAYLATSDDGGRTFSEPVRVNDVDGEVFSGYNTGPKVTPLEGDGVVVSWTRMKMFSDYPELAARYGEDNGQYLVRMARSDDGGRTFEPAVNAVDDGEITSDSYQTIHATEDGRMVMTFLDYRDGLESPEGYRTHIKTAVSEDGDGFSESTQVDDLSCECCDTSIASGEDGTVYMAYRDQDEEGQSKEELENGLTVRESVVVKSTDGGETWSEPVSLRADGWQFNKCPESGPEIDVDGDGNVHGIYYTGKEPKPGVYYTRSTDEGASFEEPTTLMTDDFFPPATISLATDGAGDAWLAWDDERERETKVHLARVTPDGGASTSEDFAAGATPAVAAVGDSVVAVWAGDGAIRALAPGAGG